MIIPAGARCVETKMLLAAVELASLILLLVSPAECGEVSRGQA